MPRDENRPVYFTAHAKSRLAQRRISTDEVAQAIRCGAWERNIGEGWRTRAAFGGRRLDVVFVEKWDASGAAAIEVLLVITVLDARKGWG